MARSSSSRSRNNHNQTNGLHKTRSGSSDGGGSSEPSSPSAEKSNGSASHEHEITKNQNQQASQAKKDYEKKKQSIITRTIWTFVMIGGFFAALIMGHIYILMIITAIQIICFKEVIAIANVPSRARSLRFTRTLNWYFLGTTMYFLYGENVVYYFKRIVLVDRILLPFATHHRFISFMLYVIGFVFFVTSLQKGEYRFQFTQFAWTHMALYLIVVQAHFVMNNTFEGLIWLFLPAALVIVNDIFAYICGMTFGRTPLIKLSPKKTVEGFVGAWIFTIAFGFLFTSLLSGYGYFICPVTDLGATMYTGLSCKPNPVFVPQTFEFPIGMPPLPYFGSSITIKPIQFHVTIMATFASLIAPFGGFFASGLKRTFGIKDFGDSIPGHGGMTDRMDCQFIMGFFTYMYFQSFIADYQTTVGDVIELGINGLSLEDLKEVTRGFGKHLVNQGLAADQRKQFLKEFLKPFIDETGIGAEVSRCIQDCLQK